MFLGILVLMFAVPMSLPLRYYLDVGASLSAVDATLAAAGLQLTADAVPRMYLRPESITQGERACTSREQIVNEDMVGTVGLERRKP